MEAKFICERCLGFDSREEREEGIRALTEAGWNHFVPYRDVQAEFALQYGRAEWVGPGQTYVCRAP